MFSPDGTLISASAAPYYGVLTRNSRKVESTDNVPRCSHIDSVLSTANADMRKVPSAENLKLPIVPCSKLGAGKHIPLYALPAARNSTKFCFPSC